MKSQGIKYRNLRIYLKTQYGRAAEAFAGTCHEGIVSELALKRRKAFAYLGYAFVFAAVTGFIIAIPGPKTPPIPLLQSGEVAEVDIVSPVTAEIEPYEASKADREELAKRVAPIFDYDDTIQDSWIQKWTDAFTRIRAEFYGMKATPHDPELLETLSQRIVEITGQRLTARDLLYLHQKRFNQATEQTFIRIAKYLLGRLIAPSDLFPSYYSTGIIVRQMNQSLNETLVHDVSRIWSIDQAREFLSHVPALLKDHKAENPTRVAEIVSNLVLPNLKFNPPSTQKRIATALGLSKHIHSVRKGQIVVHRGDRVTEVQADLLQSMERLMSPVAILKKFLVTFLVLFVFLMILFRMNVGRRNMRLLPLKDLIFFFALAVLTLLATKLSMPYLKVFFAPFNLSSGVEYLLPISTGAIVIHLIMGKEAAYSYAFLVAMTTGFMLDKNYSFSLWAFCVSASAVQSVRSCKQRTDIYRCGAWSGGLGAIMVLAFSLFQSLGLRNYEWTGLAITVSLAFVSGMLAAIITSALIPIFESLFGYTTSLKLLELSNFNHPLLHNLMMKAPGTYHHSVIVGSLAEIAADRVKANGLLARVSAYYHDIGKMNKPLYFIENQTASANPHDHLAPTMSAKILFSHVKNGVRMAREYNLGNKITSIIEQHHGTTVVSYFLNKAKQQEKPEHDHVSESDFRYPGPRPQSREAAIVMIADACEAATRSINDPTPQKIQTMVHNIINRRFLEEQFNECDLTFSDLQVIEDCFTRTLVSLYHHRIEYPSQNTPHKANQPSIPTASGYKRTN